MIFKDIIEIQKELENEWGNLIIIMNELSLNLGVYENLERELLEYIFNMNSENVIASNCSRIYMKNNAVRECLRNEKYAIRRYSLAMEEFGRKYEKISNKNILSSNFEEIKINFEEFVEHIQEYYDSGKNPVKIIALVKYMKRFVNSIKILDEQFKYIEYLSTLLQEDNEIEEDKSIFEIRFFDKLSLKEVIMILNILTIMYESCKRSFKIEDEIEIIKIETGSLLVKIKGNKIIMTFLISSMGIIANDVYNSKLNPLKKRNIQIQEFKEMLDLKKKMKELGIETNGLDGEIEALNGVLFKKSKLLLESTNKIEINEKIYETNSFEIKKIPFNYKMLEHKEDIL